MDLFAYNDDALHELNRRFNAGEMSEAEKVEVFGAIGGVLQQASYHKAQELRRHVMPDAAESSLEEYAATGATWLLRATRILTLLRGLLASIPLIWAETEDDASDTPANA